MRSWLQALTWLLATGSTLALPHPRHAGKDIATVAGSIGADAVSIQFSTPCKECFLDANDEVEFDIKVESSKHNCDISNVSINGQSLVGESWYHSNQGNTAIAVKSAGQSSAIELLTSWTFTCLNDETSLLSVMFDDRDNRDKFAKPSGFAVSFKQHGQPKFIRLQSRPIRDINAPGVDNEWADVSPEFQLIVVPPTLEGEIRVLEEIQAQIGLLAHQYHQQERKIAKMIKHDFQACHGMKCMLQTALRKAPDALALIRAHFNCPHKPARGDPSTMEEVSMHLGQDNMDVFASSDQEGLQHDELEAISHPPPPGHGMPDDGPKHHGPPFGDEHPHPPQSPEDRPHPPPEHHGPPSKGEHPPPPPPPPEHHGPPFGGFPHHGPPPDHHHPAPWAHSPGHHRPHFGHHGPHRRPLLITIASILLLLVFALAVAKVVHSKKDKLRKQRKRQNRRARCEERRNRVAYRCAAVQHRWSRWWSQFRQPESTADYEEKRTRIINQESHLEDVMQNEIRDIRRAHEIVGEMMRAEQDRQRLYHEANFGSAHHGPIYEIGESSSTSGRSMGVPALPEYQAPPPSYEAELEGEITVVDGFRYTPSNTGSTPDSSIVDCNSRISFETGSLGGLKDF